MSLYPFIALVTPSHRTFSIKLIASNLRNPYLSVRAFIKFKR